MAQLKPAGCGAIFREKNTGTHADRPRLKNLIAKLRAGDVVVTLAVYRLPRDTTNLLVIARDIQKAEAGLLSIAKPVLDMTGYFADLPRHRLPTLRSIAPA